jgi:hypothetical protein
MKNYYKPFIIGVNRITEIILSEQQHGSGKGGGLILTGFCD